MDWPAFCLEHAEECDVRGEDATDPDARAEWFQMARDWRVAANGPKPPDWRDN